MISCRIDKAKGYVRVKTKGTGADITTESLALIQTVYQQIKKQNEQAGDIYRRAIIGSLLDPNSPVWKEDDHEV